MKQTFLIIALLGMGLFSCTKKAEVTEPVEVVDSTAVETDTTEVVEVVEVVDSTAVEL